MSRLRHFRHRDQGTRVYSPGSHRPRRWLRAVAWLGSMLLVLTALPGCWDYESINRRASLIGVGVDPAPDDPNQIALTIQYPLLATQSTAGGGNLGEAAASYETLSATGYSFEETLRRLQLQMDRKIDLAQMQGVVFSEKLSPDQMNSVIAQLIRHPQLNLLCFAFATPDTAKDFMKSTPSAGAPVGNLARLMSIRQHGYAVRMQVWEYWRDETQLGVYPMLPVAVVQQVDKSIGKTGGAGKTDETVGLAGTVAYQHNEPILQLSPAETFMLNLARGQVRDMAFDYPTKEGVVNLMDIRAKSKTRTVGQGRQLKLVEKVSVMATLGKIPNSRLKPIPPSQVNAIEKASSQYLSEQILQTIEKLQGAGVDIVGFGRKYLQSHPEQEATLRENWSTMFRNAKVQVQVNVRISSKGELI